jgi:hypothetical protein
MVSNSQYGLYVPPWLPADHRSVGLGLYLAIQAEQSAELGLPPVELALLRQWCSANSQSYTARTSASPTRPAS